MPRAKEWHNKKRSTRWFNIYEKIVRSFLSFCRRAKMQKARQCTINFLQNGYFRFAKFLVVWPQQSNILDHLLKQRSVVEFCVRAGETSVTRVHRKPQETYSDDTMGVSAIWKWIQRFRKGRQGIRGEARSRKPKTTATPERLQTVDGQACIEREKREKTNTGCQQQQTPPRQHKPSHVPRHQPGDRKAGLDGHAPVAIQPTLGAERLPSPWTTERPSAWPSVWRRPLTEGCGEGLDPQLQHRLFPRRVRALGGAVAEMRAAERRLRRVGGSWDMCDDPVQLMSIRKQSVCRKLITY